MRPFIDVPACRVHEITPWFSAQGVGEKDVVTQSGWLFMGTHYRIEFSNDHKDLAALFKLSFGGQ